MSCVALPVAVVPPEVEASGHHVCEALPPKLDLRWREHDGGCRAAGARAIDVEGFGVIVKEDLQAPMFGHIVNWSPHRIASINQQYAWARRVTCLMTMARMCHVIVQSSEIREKWSKIMSKLP